MYTPLSRCPLAVVGGELYWRHTAMDEVWATGRRHVKTSKLYLKALLRRGPNIFVALAWSQVRDSAVRYLVLRTTMFVNIMTVCIFM